MRFLPTTRVSLSVIAYLVLCLSSGVGTRVAAAIHGPLRVCPDNPRYFTDDSGKAVYLTGSHTWCNRQEISIAGKTPEPFDYNAYLDFLERYNHNFIRLWVWEHTRLASWAPDSVAVTFGPPDIYLRTGPGLAQDGLPKFDLERLNPAFFDRLRSRVSAAADRGIYVMVMLFQGWSIEKKAVPRVIP